MNYEALLKGLQFILNLCLPYIQQLIESKVVPTLKRKMYEKLDVKTTKLIEDLAQNATKIKQEENEIKKSAYIEGTKLGIDTLRALADKLNQAADKITEVIE